MVRTLTRFVLALALPALLAAQTEKTRAPAAPTQTLVLEFVDGPELSVTEADKSLLKLGSGIFEGDGVPEGATVATGPTTSAELRLVPSGSIIKLAKGSSLLVRSLASPTAGQNGFVLLAGKLRAIAAPGGRYEFRSKNAVAGVRGTDFALDVGDGSRSLLMVSKGLVQFDKIGQNGSALSTLQVGSGQAADAASASFASFAFTPAQYAEEFGDLKFQRLSESDVPGQTLEGKGADLRGDESAAQAAAGESAFSRWLRESLGLELGSVTIDGTGYSKLILSPYFNLGRARLALYLPAIYSSDIFDSSSWYRPNGNNEWSFGSEDWGSDNAAALQDFARDLALKIRYFEYGDSRDPFFVRAGNLDGLTLGHGLIMRNYANDTEFPALRRIGLNAGYDAGRVGAEGIVNDLAEPEIFGARLYARPLPSSAFAVGASAVIDTAPGSELDDPKTEVGELMLIGSGLDFELPVIAQESLGLSLFADLASTMPYVKKSFDGVESGLKYDFLWKDGVPRNWGASLGGFGSFLIVDYRLEYRYSRGIFQHALFDSVYDRRRAEYALRYASFLDGGAPVSLGDAPTVMGIYGEGGVNLLDRKLVLVLGYFWPWSSDAALAEDLGSSGDEFHAKLVAKKGLIPFIGLSGFVAYDRRNFAEALSEGRFVLLDESSLLSGGLVVPVPRSPNLELAVVFATVPVRNADGSLHYASAEDEARGSPEIRPSISLEMRLHF